MSRSGRALPPAGQSSGNTNRARDQRRGMARRVQAGQQATVARAWNRVQAGNARQESIRSELKMSDGRIRYAGPKGEHVLGNKALPPSSDRALPPGRRGGDLASRPAGGAVTQLRGRIQSSGPRSVQGQPTSRGPRPGGRTVVDESPRLPQGRQGGAVSQRGGAVSRGQGGGAATSGRVTPVRVSEAPRPQIRGGGGAQRLALPAGRVGGALAKAGRGAFPLGAALMLPGAIGDVVNQTRRTGAAWNRMVADNNERNREDGGRGRSNTQGRGPRVNIPAPVPGGTGRTADIRGTQRQKPQEGPSRTPSRPTTPSAPQRPAAGGPGPRSGGSGPVASAAPRSTPASSAPRSGGSTPSAETDSWSINFLRARRGLPSLSPKEKPTVKAAADARVGPLSGNFGTDVGYRGKGPDGGDVGSRPITDRGFDTVSELLKRRRR